jgi:hypothetical protein
MSVLQIKDWWLRYVSTHTRRALEEILSNLLQGNFIAVVTFSSKICWLKFKMFKKNATYFCPDESFRNVCV